MNLPPLSSIEMPLIPPSRGSSYTNAERDLRILGQEDETNIDAEIMGDGRYCLKTVAPEVERTEQFERDRAGRLAQYVQNACVEAPNIGRNNQRIEFYSKLRKFGCFNLGMLRDSVKEELSRQFKTAARTLEAAKSTFRRCFVKNKPIPGERMDAARNESRREITHAKWELRVAEVQLAKVFGILPRQTEKGANGACWGLGLDGTPLTVIKTKSVDDRPWYKTEKVIGMRTQPEVVVPEE